MTINNCTEIRSDGGVFQLWKDDEENNFISILENGAFSNIDLSKFEKEELILLSRHINEEINKK